MKHFLFVSLLLLVATAAHAVNGQCPQTSGPLTVNAVPTRVNGISPLMVWFDATGTTDSSLTGNQTVQQDVTFTWNFGDTLSSGTSTWPYGANRNHNSRNVDSGFVAAHLYETAGRDTKYTVTVTAQDQAGNKVSCGVGVQAFEATLSNGYGTNVCAFNSTVGSGCPAGSTQITASTLSAALNSGTMSNRQVLLKCGDTFTGGVTISGVKWGVGAYGGCQDTQVGLPTITGTINVNMQCAGGASVLQTCDGRVTNLAGSTGGSGMVLINSNYAFVPAQLTFYNLLSGSTNASFYAAECVQCALIGVTQSHMGSQQGTFWNLAGNMCVNASSQYNCGQGASPVFNPIGYTAMMGSSFNGAGAGSGSGIETVRVSGCQKCVFSHNDFLNANSIGAVFKLHSNNTQNTQCIWLGQSTQDVYGRDNYFAGTSGAELVETIAQNSVTDERLQRIVFEANILAPSTGGHQWLWGVQNGTLRDNVFVNSGVTLQRRGFEGSSNNTAGSGNPCTGTGTTAAPTVPAYPQFNEALNNTFFNGSSASFSAGGAGNQAASSSVAQNNLIYLASAISNSGSGNTISNNTVTTSNNPGFTNGSGGFTLISDFKPTANFTGGVSVPVLLDALGVAWPPTWSLGAVHP